MRSLFLFHVGSNGGYAIGPLEQLFLRTGLDLSSGDPGAVHFAYRDFSKGRPAIALENVVVHDFTDRRPANLERLAGYVRANRIELVVAFDFEPIDPLVVALKKAGARTFIAYWGAPVSGASPRWKALLKAAQFALSRSTVDSMIFESKAMADTATRDRGLPRSRIDLVPLGVRTDLFRPQVSTYAHDTFGFPKDRRIFVYSGHMEHRKGVRVIIGAALELLRQRNDVAFLICGNRAGEADAFEATIRAAGQSAHLRLGGYRADLPRIFPGCFAGVIASTGWDSFTYSSVEMAACGLPVIASRLQGLAEAVLDGKTGLLFEPGDSRALAAAMERLLDEPGLARALGQAARERVERELDVETQFKAFQSVIERRMNSNASFAGQWLMTPERLQARFGRRKGFLRHCLARLMDSTGAYRKERDIDWSRVRRLVFVCQGNICRSAYAEARARSLGLRAASFGLLAGEGAEANATAVEKAARRGIDLGAHRARRPSPSLMADGDLLIGMESKHLESLARLTKAKSTLLGLWSTPARPHLEDPYGLSGAYFETCFDVIDSAVANLSTLARAARDETGSAGQGSEHDGRSARCAT